MSSRHRIGPDSRGFGNGSQWTRNLDQNYAIDAISSAALNLDATLDDVGNFTGLISSGQSYQFGYDPLYRLTDLIQGSSVLEHFDYDATGNRTAATLGGAAQSYAYPASSHRLQSINGIGRDYDNVGNTTQRDGLTYTYNGRNRLSRVSLGRTIFYSNTYNARGEREAKSLTNGMTVQRFVYDEAGRLIQTGNVPQIGLTRTLVPEQRLLWLDDQLVGVKIKATSGAYAGELLYAHTDHLGTPRALSRASNNSTVWRWPLETSAFGQHPAQPDPDGDGQVLTFNLRYPGQYFDAESGLHYNYFRDYEAGVGRYVESDPIGLLGGPSTYAYVEDYPLGRTDRFGLMSDSACCAAAGRQTRADASGFVACCEGRRIPCVKGGDSNERDDQAREFKRSCFRRHEQSHADDVNRVACDNCNKNPHPAFPSPQTTNPPLSTNPNGPGSECAAYSVSLACFMESRSSCRSRECRESLDREIELQAGRQRSFCGYGVSWF